MEKVVVDLLDQFERGKISRRQLVQSLTVGLAAASTGPALLAASPLRSPFKGIGVNHISFGVADYGRTRDFYAALFGAQVSCDDGKQCYLRFGDSYLIPRKSRQPDGAASVDHIAYTLESWDKNYVEDELRKRGLEPKPDTDYSFHVRDPDGYNLQICGKQLMDACR